MDLWKGFQKLDTQHKGDLAPAASKSASEPVRSKRYASDPDRPTDLLIAAALAVAVIVLAKWFAP